MKPPRIENMQGNHGPVKNQFKIFTEDGVYFQSYSTLIAFKPYGSKIQLDETAWDYSRTTGKYRNIFLNETKAETEKKIKTGEYQLVDLNA
jgi:hypothetical protein